MRTRLVALILIPTVVGVLLAGIQLADAVGTNAEYRRLTQVAELVQRLSALSHELGKERTLVAWSRADRRPTTHMARLREQREVVDKAKIQVLDATAAIGPDHSARVQTATQEIRRWLNGLDGLRDAILGESAPARAAIRTYSSLIQVLRGLQGELATVGGDEDLIGDATAFAALHQAKEEVSRQQVILLVALVERRLDYDDLADFLGSWDRQQAELATFDTEAGAAEAGLYKRTVRGFQVDRADAMRQRALAQLREYRTIRDLDITTKRDLTVWYTSTGATVDAMRKVEEDLAGQLVKRAGELSDAEQRNAIVSGAVILVLLLLVLLITVRVAGSLVRPLRRLRAEALEIAGRRLPETVQRLREGGESAGVEVPSVGIDTRDEIGEVARAFDEVHREAVRLAGEEAKLRANVNAMFVNLSRRSQTLVERQLQLIEDLEHGEEDESRLSQLFRLDHLATRMRRNSENLLVLAGQEGARKWSEPVPLVDVARASLSEVENYERVSIQIRSDVEVVGPAVTDVVHLLAELIENAISFSPRESKVVVTSAPAEGGGVLVSVSDQGIGMTAEELAEANWRLAHPPVVDVSVARRMGLFVVGRLALRHGIQVQLRAREGGPGLTAQVLLPAVLIASAPVMAGGGSYPSFEAATQYGFGGSPATRDPGHDLADEATSVFSAAPVDTPWPDSVPPPGAGSWPSFAEEPQALPTRERPGRPAAEPGIAPYGDRPSAFADEPAFPSFTAPGGARPEEPAFPSFGDRREEPAFPSFTDRREEPAFPPVADRREEPAFPSFTDHREESAFPSFGDRREEPAFPSFADRREEPSFSGRPAAEEPLFPSFAETASAAAGEPGSSSWSSPWSTQEAPELTGPLPAYREGDGQDTGAAGSIPTSDWFTKPAILSRPAPPEPPAPAEGSAAPAGRPQPQARPETGAPDQALPQRSPGAGLPQGAPVEPVTAGHTPGGLPRRVPKANLVPGSARSSESLFGGGPAEQVSPDQLRSRLSSFQQGVRQGREQLKED
ncbi:sensor histidine kinase [Thermoactinospora rubra]|uniref:sensor histidine kinase n=1 Tax=Thermoactinospora rubra TaxID=1088767 RepID=UPI0013020A14|nr:sensor histidine kinase [Thermoactinospora rubra]